MRRGGLILFSNHQSHDLVMFVFYEFRKIGLVDTSQLSLICTVDGYSLLVTHSLQSPAPDSFQQFYKPFY